MRENKNSLTKKDQAWGIPISVGVFAMFGTYLRQFFSSPALFFAVGVALFYGHEGGIKLVVALVFLAFILVCQALRVAGIPDSSRWRALITRPSTQQGLVGVLCLLIAILTLTLKPLAEMGHRDALFAAVAVLAMISNICTARNMERGFAMASTITLGSVLLVPQLWGLASSTISMIYNGGYTMYVSLPLLLLSVWLAIFGRFGPYLVNAGMPYYLSFAHNLWYGFCNAIGEHPSALIVTSCIASAIGGLILARMVVDARGTAMPLTESVYVEIPGVAYRAPRFAHTAQHDWQPLTFRI